MCKALTQVRFVQGLVDELTACCMSLSHEDVYNPFLNRL